MTSRPEANKMVSGVVDGNLVLSTIPSIKGLRLFYMCHLFISASKSLKKIPPCVLINQAYKV